MTTWIDTEKLIAIALWWKMKNGQDSVSFSEISNYGSWLQEACNDAGVDVLIINHSFSEAIHGSEFVEEISLNGYYYAKKKKMISILDLERVFAYCPMDFLNIATNTPLNFTIGNNDLRIEQ